MNQQTASRKRRRKRSELTNPAVSPGSSSLLPPREKVSTQRFPGWAGLDNPSYSPASPLLLRDPDVEQNEGEPRYTVQQKRWVVSGL